MKIAGVTNKAGEKIKALDFRVENDVTIAGTPVSSKPAIKEFLVKKDKDSSTIDLFSKVLISKLYDEVLFEYYDSSNSNKPYLTIKLLNAFVTSFYWLAAECPTCLQLEHQVGFKATKYEVKDISSGKVFNYDTSNQGSY